MEKIEKKDLFIGCLGNGLVVSNKGKIVHGDYENICHIADYGKVTWYMGKDRLSDEVIEVIKNEANKKAEIFDSWMSKLNDFRKFFTLSGYTGEMASIYAITSIDTWEGRNEYLRNVLRKKANWK